MLYLEDSKADLPILLPSHSPPPLIFLEARSSERPCLEMILFLGRVRVNSCDFASTSNNLLSEYAGCLVGPWLSTPLFLLSARS